MAVDGHLNFDTKIITKGFDKGIDSLKATFLKLGGVIAGVFSVRVLTAYAKEAKALWQTQLEAETKLETVLGRNLGATKAQIQAVKDYASALQEVGVIGDEVQLSGLQELSTYIESADSLKTMNEVLNDMLAQQYGLNASAESAVTIATMLGKVLNGQTGALSRYGYSFTQAQEQLLKFGTEEQRVATLADVVEASVGGMNEALANTDAGRLKQLDNTLGDIKEQFGAAVTQIEVVFLPLLKRVADFLTEIANLARDISQSMAEVFGSGNAKAVSTAAESYEDIAEAAEEAAESNDKSLMSFDQINKIGGDEASAESDSGANTPFVMGDDEQGEGRFTEFFRSLKESWEKYGKPVVSALKSGFEAAVGVVTSVLGTIWADLSTLGADLSTLGAPLEGWFSGDFTNLLSTIAGTSRNILTGLYDTVSRVFSDLWNVAVFPVLQSLVTVGLPMVTQFSDQFVQTLGTLFDGAKEIFDTLWSEAAVPVLSGLATLFADTLQSLSDFWNEWGAPLFDLLRGALKSTKDVILDIWYIVLKPIFDAACESISELWSGHLKPLLDDFLGLVGEIVAGGIEIYSEFILPMVESFTEVLGPVVAKIGKFIVGIFGGVLSSIVDAARGIINALKGVVQFIRGAFTGDWRKCWTGIKNIFKGIWDALYSLIKTPLNLIISAVNVMIGAIEDAINYLIDGLNAFSFDIPDWVPLVGGSSFGFDIGYVDFPEIPKLAQGTVVPANYGEFLAVLGDNKRETEVVSPVSTIEQAVMSALVKLGTVGGQKQSLTVQVVLDKRIVGQAVIDDINERTRRTGYSPIKG